MISDNILREKIANASLDLAKQLSILLVLIKN